MEIFVSCHVKMEIMSLTNWWLLMLVNIIECNKRWKFGITLKYPSHLNILKSWQCTIPDILHLTPMPSMVSSHLPINPSPSSNYDSIIQLFFYNLQFVKLCKNSELWLCVFILEEGKAQINLEWPNMAKHMGRERYLKATYKHLWG